MSNAGKYESQNPLKKALLRRFLGRARLALPENEELSILDVGVGEGLFWERNPRRRVTGVDLRPDALALAADVGVAVASASAFELPFGENQFDYVVAIEILEHLPEPDLAVAELARVTRHGGLITVPWEPWFSLMVLSGSGSHVRRLGREPEHIQAFGPNELSELLYSQFGTVTIRKTLPWLVATVSV